MESTRQDRPDKPEKPDKNGPSDVERSDEQDLITRAQAGDIKAFEELVGIKRDRVFRTAYRIIGNEDDAKEVAQLVFIRLWKSLGGYDRRHRFDTWMYRIVVNMAIDHFRRGRRRKKEIAFQEVSSVRPEDEIAQESRVDDEISFNELNRIFQRVSEALSERQRTVFILKEIEGLPTREIARVLRCTESTVRNHLFQAKKALRREMRKRYPEYVPRQRKAKA